MSIEIRNYCEQDCKEIAELFFETVHSVNSKDYNKEQLAVWATGKPDLKQWNHYSLVAVKQGQIVGFADMTQNRYLDRLYVHKELQRQNIATMLCDRLESWAKQQGVFVLETHASITAKPF